MEDAGGEPPLKDRLLTENVSTPKSVELSSCMCGSGVDDNLGSPSVFSMLLPSMSVCHHSTVRMPASTVLLLCFKCFK